ncbi:MAG: hypothetical protein Q4F95_10535 [Oscillospiraceae bacterium]|nr:hypothetical protein [Oscillospiraceae bacterium]
MKHSEAAGSIKKKLKRISLLIAVIMSISVFSGCMKTELINDSGKTRESTKTPAVSSPHMLSEYYIPSDYDMPGDYMYIQDVICKDDTTFITGTKNFAQDKDCILVSLTDHSEVAVNIDFSYDCIIAACIRSDKLFVLYDKEGGSYLCCVDLKSNKILNTIRPQYYVSQMTVSEDTIYFLGRQASVYCYDFELNYKSRINLSEITGESDEIEYRYFVADNDNLYLWGDNYTDAAKVLVAVNSSSDVIYKKEFTDMEGFAYPVYLDNDKLILTASSTDEENLTYIDAVDITNGEPEEWYEVPDAQFIYWGYDDDTVIGSSISEVFSYNLQTNEKQSLQSKKWSNNNTPYLYKSGDYLISFPDTQGEIYTVCTKTHPDGSSSELLMSSNQRSCLVTDESQVYGLSRNGDNTLSLNFYGDDNSITRCINLSYDGNSLSQNVLFYEGKIYAEDMDKGSLLVFDDEGNIEDTKPLDKGKAIKKITGSHGCIYIFLSSDSVSNATVMTYKDQVLKPMQNIADTQISQIFAGDEIYNLYYISGNIIYGYKESKALSERIMNLTDSGVIYAVESFSRIASDTFFCSYSDGICLKYITLKKADEQTLKRLNSRQIIQLAGNNMTDNTALLSQIAKFNLENQDYFIETKDYTSGKLSSHGGFFSSMYNDIVTGDIPDIFVLGSDFNADLFARLGLFEDLSGFIDNDTEIHKEDYFENILELYQYDDKLYGITAGFSLNSIIRSHPSAAGSGMNLTQFLDMAETENLKFSNVTREELYDYLILAHADEFVDYKEATASFNSEQFIRLLGYVEKACDMNGTLNICNVYDFKQFNCFTALYGEDYSMFDISQTGESLACADITMSYGLAVCASSSVKDGAWQFIRSFLSEDFQSGIDCCFPVSVKAFDKLFDAAAEYNGCTISCQSDERQEDIEYKIDLSEDERMKIKDIIKSVTSANTQSDAAISAIVKENIDLYLNGGQTAQETAEVIQQKVSLYLQEIC